MPKKIHSRKLNGQRLRRLPRSRNNGNAQFTAQSTLFEPLDHTRRQIRVLVLFPGQHDSELCGQLQMVSLDDGPQYDAISYVWGAPGSYGHLHITNAGSIIIGTNLQNLLTTMRKQDEPLTLWVDAICINQEDLRERERQVELMRYIYSVARTVRVWLDVDVCPDSAPFRAARRLDHWSLYHPERDETKWIFDCGRGDRNLRPITLTDHAPAFWRPLAQLFANEYWTRVWTQQELFLAQRIEFYLPRGTLPLGTLARFNSAVLRIDEDDLVKDWDRLFSYGHLVPPVTILESIEEGFGRASDRGPKEFLAKDTLLLLYLNTADLNTTDTKDRVYGLLGLASDTESYHIDVNYGLSLTAVYCKVIEHFLHTYRSLLFLCYSCRRFSRVEHHHEFPSWLPVPEKRAELRRIDGLEYWRGSINIDLERLRQGILQVKGIKIDAIEISAKSNSLDQPISRWIAQLKSICVRAGFSENSWSKALELLYYSSGSADEIWDYQTVRGDLVDETHNAIVNGIRNVALWPEKIGFPDMSIPHLMPGTGLSDGEDLGGINMKENPAIMEIQAIRSIYFALIGATFIGTTDNRLGLAYQCCRGCAAKKGDEIWVLFACPMLMVLRPLGQSYKKQYKVIGPAKVPKQMQDEFWDDVREKGRGPAPSSGHQMSIIELI